MCRHWQLKLIGSLMVFVFLSVFCLAQGSQDTSYYIITENEYQNLLQNCEQLKVDLQNSQENLQQSVQTQQQLKQTLQDYQTKINDLLSKTTNLENSLTLSEQESQTLRDEIATISVSFEQYKKEVNSKLLKARIESFLIGLGAGFIVGYISNK